MILDGGSDLRVGVDVAIWLYRLGRKVSDLANDDPVTTYRIGKN